MTHDLSTVKPDPRPEPTAGGMGLPKRGRALDAPRSTVDAIKAAKCLDCRLCGTRNGVQPHHLVPRGMGGTIGGEWVESNIVGLCGRGNTDGCHGLVERRDPDACHVLRSLLTGAEVAYILSRKSAAWLDRRYPLIGATS